jgi:hypothetical protein
MKTTSTQGGISMRKAESQELLHLLGSDVSPVRATLYLRAPRTPISSRGKRRSRLRELERLRAEAEHAIARLSDSPLWWRAIDWSEIEAATCETGVAVFVSPSGALWTPAPLIEESLVCVADSFHVKPVVNWLQAPGSFLHLHLVREEATPPATQNPPVVAT